MSFFGAESPLMRALSDITTLLILNILTAVCCIPIVTAGAALTSLHYMIMKLMDHEDGRIASRYFKQLRGNLKTATVPWLIVLFAGVLIYLDYGFFRSQEDTMLRALTVPAYFFAIVLFALIVWLFPLMARYDNRIGATFQNALILAVSKLPRTLAMIAIYFVVTFVLSQSWKLLPLFFLFGLSLPGYLSALFYYPVLKKMIAKSNGEEDSQDADERE